MGVFRLHPDDQRIVAHSGLYQRSLAPSDHGDNTTQIINNRGNKSRHGRWPAALTRADQEGNVVGRDVALGSTRR